MAYLRFYTRLLAAISVFLLFVMAGCGGGSAPAPTISVSVSPTSATLIGGATQTFTATVTNDSANAGATWTATTGSISSTGVYTAPAVITTTSATVTATSKSDSTKSASATITLTPISVSITTTPVAMIGGASQTLAATVAADGASAGVTWSASTGTITTAGVYTAPAVITVTSATVTATSKTDTTKSASVTVTLTPISVGAPSPGTVALAGGGTQAFTVAVSNDGSSSGVTWSIGSGVGTLTNVTGTGVTYNAPAVISGSSPVSVSLVATSVKDPTKSSSAATITLNPIAVSITTTTAGITLDSGQTMTLAAAVTNDSSASGVTFSATGAGSVSPASSTGNSPSTTLTATGTVASAVTVSATSTKDSTKTASTSSIAINPALTITTSAGALAAGITNAAYPGATIATSGGTGTKTFAIASGALPTGLTLNAGSGAISGTVTGTASIYSFAVKVTDTATTPVTVTSGTFTIAVTAPPLVWTVPTTQTLNYTVGTAITPITLTTTGGTGTITYTVNSGALPAGLSLVGNVLSGTPTAPTIVAGNAITFLATDSATPTAQTAVSATVTLVVNPVTLAISTTSLSPGYVGVSYSTQLTSTGGISPINWTLTGGSLTGTGLTLSSSGLLSGTPLITESGLSLTFQATDSATNQQQTKTITLPLTVTNALSVTTPSLPTATVGNAYTFSLAAAGGAGTGYTWTVLSGASSLTALSISLGTNGSFSGTPAGTGSANITVQVKDSANNTASQTYTLTVVSVLTLPSPNPSSLGGAIVGTAYTGAINAAGGTPSYTWTINGSALATNGTLVSIGNGLSVSNTGSGLLSVTGTPASATTTTFTAKITDGASTTAGPFTYSVTAAATYTVSGSVSYTNGCGSTTPPPITIAINTSPVQTTTTNNGSFSFAGVPNGSYTITPSITGPASAFSPATQNITVNNGNITTNFGVTLGYTVSGSVSYAGAKSGKTYVYLTNNSCSGNSAPGTTISTSGAYTIRGVPPGTYTLTGFLDALGYGSPNASDPSGSNASISVVASNVAGANVTLSDPASVTLSSGPGLNGVFPMNTAALASYNAEQNSSGVETPTSYTLQWSTSSTFASITGSKTFPATGTNGTNVWLLNGLTNAAVYYFRAYATSTGTAQSAYSSTVGPVTIGAGTTGNTVSGAVTFTGAATGPLYTGFYDGNSGIFYGQYFANPVSAQAFTIQVPTSTTYFQVGVIDQNNNGIIDPGDITNTQHLKTFTTISGATTGQNLTLPSTNSSLTITTTHYRFVNGSNISQNYYLNFTLAGVLKLPISASIVSGPNIINPIDIGNCITCGNGGDGFAYSVPIGTIVPSVGDTYGVAVTYSDGTSETVSAAVTGVITTFPSNLLPQTGTSVSTQPTFTWTDPANASNYTYSFQLSNGSGNVWQIPGNNSNSSGFASTITSITWNVDPTGGGSTPSIASLSTATSYQWQIQATDANGNQTVTQVSYQP